MKLTRGLSIVLIVLTVLGWCAFILAPQDKAKLEIEKHRKQAEEYIDRGLYQLAIEEYNDALSIEPDNEDLWSEKLNTYELLYSENDSNDIYSEFLTEANSGVSLFPKNADFVLISSNLYIVKENYKSAYKVLSKAVEAGVKDDRVLELQFKSKYAFKLQSNKYSDAKGFVNNYFVVKDYDSWSYLDEKGTKVNSNKISFAGPVGSDNIRFISDTKSGRNYLVDDEKIIHGFFNEIPDEAGFYSEGFITIKRNGKYYYYNSLGDIQFDGRSFDFAGTFNKGTAAVKMDGSWYIIDKDGNKVSDESYDDIILNTDFTYNKYNIQIFKYKNASKYSVLYKDNVIGEFDDVGVLADNQLIAVCIDSKWGYINTKGDIVIEPQFVLARSFSNGLAAVYNGQNWGYINTDGELAIDYMFLDAGYFSKEGYSLVLSEKVTNNGTQEDEYVWRLLRLYNKVT